MLVHLQLVAAVWTFLLTVDLSPGHLVLDDAWMTGFVPPARVLIAALSAFGTVLALASPLHASQARAARNVNLAESARLHRTSSNGVHLNEQGNASGTISGTIYIHLRISSNHVSAEVSIYPRGGSLTATGTAAYHVNGGYAPFSGSLTVRRGTGTYAHAHSGALRFTGSIRRSNDSVTAQLSGPLSY